MTEKDHGTSPVTASGEIATGDQRLSNFAVEWIDRGREPQCKPDPNFPKGKDCDFSFGAEATCTATLPYPAKRCGLYIVECKTCGIRIGITTAGRPDDPCSVKIACIRPEVVQ